MRAGGCGGNQAQGALPVHHPPSPGNRTFSPGCPFPPSGLCQLLCNQSRRGAKGNVSCDGRPYLWNCKGRKKTKRIILSTFSVFFFLKRKAKSTSTWAVVWDCSTSQSGRQKSKYQNLPRIPAAACLSQTLRPCPWQTALINYSAISCRAQAASQFSKTEL